MLTKDLVGLYTSRIGSIESIFSSYRTLYEIYATALKTAKANRNTVQAFENATNSVKSRQLEISNQLYSQGFILLTGASEALLKDLFESLLKDNFTEINPPSYLNFSGNQVQQAIKAERSSELPIKSLSEKFGELTHATISDSKNPIEKINFQNVKTTQQIFFDYFGITLNPDDRSKRIHKYWQMRHCLIHNNGFRDQRYINNVKKVELLGEDEKEGQLITVQKTEFDDTKQDFLGLFAELDKQIRNVNLNCELINLEKSQPSIEDLF